MKKKNIFLSVTLNLITAFLFLILINLLIFFFNDKIINQNNFKRNHLSYLPISYQVYYPSTNNRKFNDYIAILGDSHALGVGEAYFNLKIEDYSIAHILKKINPENNYITFAWPGGGSISILKHFKFHTDNWLYGRIYEKPKKIIYLFSEENDFTDDYNDKYLNKTEYAFTKKEYIKSAFPLFYYFYLQIKLSQKKLESSILIENTIFFKKRKINFNNKSGGISVPEISKIEQDKTLHIIYNNFLDLKTNSKEMYVVYIPSVATIYNIKNPIKAISFRDKSIINISKENMDDYNVNSSMQIENLCKKLNIKFINLTLDLKEKAKNHLIHGPKDWGHFNKTGHEFIASILSNKIN